MDYSKIIPIDPAERSGKAGIRGLRIAIYDVLNYLAAGMTEARILANFPVLREEDISACLAFAADRERKFGILSVPDPTQPSISRKEGKNEGQKRRSRGVAAHAASSDEIVREVVACRSSARSNAMRTLAFGNQSDTRGRCG